MCWSGVLFFSEDQLDQVIKAAAEWKATVMSEDDSILVGTTHNQEDGSPIRSSRTDDQWIELISRLS